jgi:hypothetical protein
MGERLEFLENIKRNHEHGKTSLLQNGITTDNILKQELLVMDEDSWEW